MEITHIIKLLKNNKVLREDNINAELIRTTAPKINIEDIGLYVWLLKCRIMEESLMIENRNHMPDIQKRLTIDE